MIKQLEKLNHGKNTIKTMFLTQDAKVTKITTLTHSIANVTLLTLMFVSPKKTSSVLSST